MDYAEYEAFKAKQAKKAQKKEMKKATKKLQELEQVATMTDKIEVKPMETTGRPAWTKAQTDSFNNKVRMEQKRVLRMHNEDPVEILKYLDENADMEKNGIVRNAWVEIRDWADEEINGKYELPWNRS